MIAISASFRSTADAIMDWEVLLVCGVEFESAISSQIVRCGTVEKGRKFQVNQTTCLLLKYSPVHFYTNHAGPHFQVYESFGYMSVNL
jgi:hypothetical protein